MVTMKSYTDIEQSKKLAEILPHYAIKPSQKACELFEIKEK